MAVFNSYVSLPEGNVWNEALKKVSFQWDQGNNLYPCSTRIPASLVSWVIEWSHHWLHQTISGSRFSRGKLSNHPENSPETDEYSTPFSPKNGWFETQKPMAVVPFVPPFLNLLWGVPGARRLKLLADTPRSEIATPTGVVLKKSAQKTLSPRNHGILMVYHDMFFDRTLFDESFR